MPVPILKQGDCLIASIQSALTDADLLELRDELSERVGRYRSKGVIIDVRNNGGGNTSDQLIDILERAPNAIYVPRDAAPQLGPGQALNVPMVVMMAESSFSNAEMFFTK